MVEKVWYALMLKIFFSFEKIIFHDLLPRLMEKLRKLYVLPTLTKCHFTTTNFDLWMSKVGHDVFAFVINFLSGDWQPKHITLNLFEPIDTSEQTLVKKLT